jgi:hypothetical protein
MRRDLTEFNEGQFRARSPNTEANWRWARAAFSQSPKDEGVYLGPNCLIHRMIMFLLGSRPATIS